MLHKDLVILYSHKTRKIAQNILIYRTFYDHGILLKSTDQQMKDPIPSTAPVFGLYGEAPGRSGFFLHIEEIFARSAIYNWEIDAHLHQHFHQIIYLTEGAMSARINQEEFELNGPCVAVIPAKNTHAFKANQTSLGFVLTINNEFFFNTQSTVETALFEKLFEKPAVTTIEQKIASQLLCLFQIMKDEFGKASESNNLIFSKIAQATCLLIERISPTYKVNITASKEKNQLINQYLLMVEKNYSADIKIPDYAAMLSVTADKLARIIQDVLGKTPGQVIYDRRLKEACKMLIYTSATISEISLATGFSEAAYFCRFFKKKMGMTPLSYRKVAS